MLNENNKTKSMKQQGFANAMAFSKVFYHSKMLKSLIPV